MRVALLRIRGGVRSGARADDSSAPAERDEDRYARLDDGRAWLFDRPSTNASDPWPDPAHREESSGGLREDACAPPWLGGIESGQSVPWTEADLRCPVRPTKIVCIGRNYAAHARELGHEVPSEPLLFLKPPSSLLAHGGEVVLPADSARVEHEAELAVIIGRQAKNVTREHARAYVFGYSCACDVTARDLQRKDVQFTRAKGFDTFCPVGPWIETDLDPVGVAVRCRVNGQTRQDGTTAHMIFDVPTLVAYVSRAMTLEPGDVILTGTPEGVGPLASGDALEVEIEGVGTLKLSVRA